MSKTKKKARESAKWMDRHGMKTGSSFQKASPLGRNSGKQQQHRSRGGGNNRTGQPTATATDRLKKEQAFVERTLGGGGYGGNGAVFSAVDHQLAGMVDPRPRNRSERRAAENRIDFRSGWKPIGPGGDRHPHVVGGGGAGGSRSGTDANIGETFTSRGIDEQQAHPQWQSASFYRSFEEDSHPDVQEERRMCMSPYFLSPAAAPAGSCGVVGAGGLDHHVRHHSSQNRSGDFTSSDANIHAKRPFCIVGWTVDDVIARDRLLTDVVDDVDAGDGHGDGGGGGEAESGGDPHPPLRQISDSDAADPATKKALVEMEMDAGASLTTSTTTPTHTVDTTHKQTESDRSISISTNNGNSVHLQSLAEADDAVEVHQVVDASLAADTDNNKTNTTIPLSDDVPIPLLLVKVRMVNLSMDAVMKHFQHLLTKATAARYLRRRESFQKNQTNQGHHQNHHHHHLLLHGDGDGDGDQMSALENGFNNNHQSSMMYLEEVEEVGEKGGAKEGTASTEAEDHFYLTADDGHDGTTDGIEPTTLKTAEPTDDVVATAVHATHASSSSASAALVSAAEAAEETDAMFFFDGDDDNDGPKDEVSDRNKVSSNHQKGMTEQTIREGGCIETKKAATHQGHGGHHIDTDLAASTMTLSSSPSSSVSSTNSTQTSTTAAQLTAVNNPNLKQPAVAVAALPPAPPPERMTSAPRVSLLNIATASIAERGGVAECALVVRGATRGAVNVVLGGGFGDGMVTHNPSIGVPRRIQGGSVTVLDVQEVEVDDGDNEAADGSQAQAHAEECVYARDLTHQSIPFLDNTVSSETSQQGGASLMADGGGEAAGNKGGGMLAAEVEAAEEGLNMMNTSTGAAAGEGILPKDLLDLEADVRKERAAAATATAALKFTDSNINSSNTTEATTDAEAIGEERMMVMANGDDKKDGSGGIVVDNDDDDGRIRFQRYEAPPVIATEYEMMLRGSHGITVSGLVDLLDRVRTHGFINYTSTTCCGGLPLHMVYGTAQKILECTHLGTATPTPMLTVAPTHVCGDPEQQQKQQQQQPASSSIRGGEVDDVDGNNILREIHDERTTRQRGGGSIISGVTGHIDAENFSMHSAQLEKWNEREHGQGRHGHNDRNLINNSLFSPHVLQERWETAAISMLTLYAGMLSRGLSSVVGIVDRLEMELTAHSMVASGLSPPPPHPPVPTSNGLGAAADDEQQYQYQQRVLWRNQASALRAAREALAIEMDEIYHAQVGHRQYTNSNNNKTGNPNRARRRAPYEDTQKYTGELGPLVQLRGLQQLLKNMFDLVERRSSTSSSTATSTTAADPPGGLGLPSSSSSSLPLPPPPPPLVEAVAALIPAHITTQILSAATNVHWNYIATARLQMYGDRPVVGDIVCTDPSAVWDGLCGGSSGGAAGGGGCDAVVSGNGGGTIGVESALDIDLGSYAAAHPAQALFSAFPSRSGGGGVQDILGDAGGGWSLRRPLRTVSRSLIEMYTAQSADNAPPRKIKTSSNPNQTEEYELFCSQRLNLKVITCPIEAKQYSLSDVLLPKAGQFIAGVNTLPFPSLTDRALTHRRRHSPQSHVLMPNHAIASIFHDSLYFPTTQPNSTVHSGGSDIEGGGGMLMRKKKSFSVKQFQGLAGLACHHAAPLATYRRLAGRPLSLSATVWDDKHGIRLSTRGGGGGGDVGVAIRRVWGGGVGGGGSDEKEHKADAAPPLTGLDAEGIRRLMCPSAEAARGTMTLYGSSSSSMSGGLKIGAGGESDGGATSISGSSGGVGHRLGIANTLSASAAPSSSISSSATVTGSAAAVIPLARGRGFRGLGTRSLFLQAMITAGGRYAGGGRNQALLGGGANYKKNKKMGGGGRGGRYVQEREPVNVVSTSIKMVLSAGTALSSALRPVFRVGEGIGWMHPDTLLAIHKKQLAKSLKHSQQQHQHQHQRTPPSR